MDVGRDMRRGDFLRNRMLADVVAMKRDIERAGEHRALGIGRGELAGEPAGEFNAPVGDAEQQKAGGMPVSLGNSRPEPRDGSLNLRRTDALGIAHRFICDRCRGGWEGFYERNYWPTLGRNVRSTGTGREIPRAGDAAPKPVQLKVER